MLTTQLALDVGSAVGIPTEFTVPAMIGAVLMAVGVALILVANNRKQILSATGRLGEPPLRTRVAFGGGIALLIIGAVLLMGRWGTSADSRPGANRVVLAATAGGLPQATTPDWFLRQPGVGEGMLVASYVHPNHLDTKPPAQQSLVYFVGAEGSFDPQSALKAAFDQLKAPTVDGVHDYDAGPLGGALRCTSFASGGQVQSHCLWADNSTMGHLIAPELTEPETAALLVKMRADLERSR